MRRRFLALLVIPFLAACGANSLSAPGAHYLPNDVIPPQSLAAPLAEHSAAWDKEVKTILALQKNPNEKEVAQAREEKKLKPELVTFVLGENFSRENYPATYKILDNAGRDCRETIRQAKFYWRTTRPYLMNVGVKSLIPDADATGAYPSGHAACSVMWADILGQILPQKQKALQARAQKIADHRVLTGMHFPHDIAAGRKIGNELFKKLKASESYQQDLARAKEEVARQKK